MKFIGTCFIVVVLYLLIFNPDGQRIARGLFSLGKTGIHVTAKLVNYTVDTVNKEIVNK